MMKTICKHTERLPAIDDYYVCVNCAAALKQVKTGAVITLVPVRVRDD